MSASEVCLPLFCLALCNKSLLCCKLQMSELGFLCRRQNEPFTWLQKPDLQNPLSSCQKWVKMLVNPYCSCSLQFCTRHDDLSLERDLSGGQTHSAAFLQMVWDPPDSQCAPGWEAWGSNSELPKVVSSPPPEVYNQRPGRPLSGVLYNERYTFN